MQPQADLTLTNANPQDPSGVFGPGSTATPTEEVTSPTGKPVTVGQVGKSGTYIFNGIITREEYNPDLMRWEALKNYDIMRRSDATVAALLDVIKLPILSATWSVEAASDDDLDIEIAEWVRFNLFDNYIVFPDLLSEILTYQDFGYSVFEKVWDYADWENPNGKTNTMICLKDLQSRKQRTIYRWQTNDTTTPQFGITQYVPGGTYSVPGDKLCIFTRKKEGDNYEGISVLRASYKHWKMKDALELIEAIRHERQGLGVLEIVPPEGANEDDIDAAIENARQARASEEGVIKHPAGWTIEWMDMKAGTTQMTDINGTLEYHKREMLKSVLAQFLELGGNKGGSGSKATSQDHSEMFDHSEEFTAKYIAHVIQRKVIKELVDLNYSDVKKYPTLEHSKIGDDDLEKMGGFISQVMTAGGITPDPELEQWIRNLMHAPDLPDDLRDNYPAKNQNPAPVTPLPIEDQKETPPSKPEKVDEQSKTAKDAIRQAQKARIKLLDTLLG